ncbi:MAG TPA: hypothetical protein VLN49_16495 [Gemmatimonadaceae bacterium]|nr:hypothetical protein [Gemmatimonadaceae bacterium]
MPVVRVDDEVWKWLQSQAQPFEDTPNTVLRRVAGLDPPVARSDSARSATPVISAKYLTTDEKISALKAVKPRDSAQARQIATLIAELEKPTVPQHSDVATNRNTVAERVTGAQLNRKYRLGVRHALYHKDGTFYERLARFPGALCDPRGFVRYENEQQFAKDQRLNIGEKVNIYQTLASHPRYQRFADGH